MTLEKRASLEATTVARLHKEQDGLLQTTKRLHLECGAAHEECDQAFQEHDQAYQERDEMEQKVGSL